MLRSARAGSAIYDQRVCPGSLAKLTEAKRLVEVVSFDIAKVALEPSSIPFNLTGRSHERLCYASGQVRRNVRPQVNDDGAVSNF